MRLNYVAWQMEWWRSLLQAMSCSRGNSTGWTTTPWRPHLKLVIRMPPMQRTGPARAIRAMSSCPLATDPSPDPSPRTEWATADFASVGLILYTLALTTPEVFDLIQVLAAKVVKLHDFAARRKGWRDRE